MLIILDRDGVINFDSPDYIKSPEEWIPIPGSIEAIAQLSKKHSVIIATNQSGINRGLFSLDTLNKIHEKMIMQINAAGGKLKAIYFCPHTPTEDCDCRKPRPGMLLQIQKDFNVKNTDMIYIGDSEKDYEAAQAMGCSFILVKTGNGENTSKKIQQVKMFDHLLAAALDDTFCKETQ
ncbi:MAG: D-glycero-beta-D-manno-heptose 1,7-bisphosphate 7-phosphatase [Coxiellaceae bacterium]|nr:D-glycero-beta-D-manno-heptose 1,7-bisphosphate 7-phosphatase [Coxiellaceae bacterium]